MFIIKKPLACMTKQMPCFDWRRVDLISLIKFNSHKYQKMYFDNLIGS